MTRVTIVTGAAAGLGRSIAEALSSDGDRLVVVDRDRGVDDVASAIRNGGGAAEAHLVDVANEDQVAELAKELRLSHERVDVLVNNAGLALREGSVADLTRKAWDLTIAVNLTSVYLMCHHILPLMSDGGCILNVAAAAPLRAVPGTDAYVAAKGGVVALTKAMAVSIKDRGIRCNVVCPGVVVTDEVRRRLDDPLVQAMLERAMPLGRDFGRPDELSAVVRFLCSSGASYMNGAVVAVDGGATA